jgi:hypothetical protein
VTVSLSAYKAKLQFIANPKERQGKIALYLGTSATVDTAINASVSPSEPALRLSTNTYEARNDYSFLPPKKPIEKTLVQETDLAHMTANGLQGERAGFYYPLKRQQQLGLLITGKDTEGLLNAIGQDNWQEVVNNPIHLSCRLFDYLQERDYKDSDNKPVMLAILGETGMVSSSTVEKPTSVNRLA